MCALGSGVQTCALPIWGPGPPQRPRLVRRGERLVEVGGGRDGPLGDRRAGRGIIDRRDIAPLAAPPGTPDDELTVGGVVGGRGPWVSFPPRHCELRAAQHRGLRWHWACSLRSPQGWRI